MADTEADIDIRMDDKALYREEIFTDRRVGTIQRLTPVDEQGNPDPSRSVLYVGQTQLMTRAGPLPISFELPGESLGDAARQFADAANAAVEETMQRLDEMRREAASSIIVPEGGQMPGGGAAGPAGLGGGGKIRMP